MAVLAKEIYKNRYIYLFLLPGLLFLAAFAYGPMYGLILSFKDYSMKAGIMDSPWANPIYKNFITIQNDRMFWNAFFNTFRIGFFQIVIGFPFPIILAILINEMRGTKYKKVLQTVYTFPHFLSWVLVGGLIVSFFASDGFVNIIIQTFTGKRVDFLAKKELVRPMLYISSVWKGAGWASIIYLAGITGINPELYEAAEIDGANRFGKIIYITWPGIKSTAVILLILAFGGIMGGGFDQIMNMVNPVVQDYAETIDTFIYRRTFQGIPNYGVSTAMGLFKSILNFSFLLLANKIAKLLGEGGVV